LHRPLSLLCLILISLAACRQSQIAPAEMGTPAATLPSPALTLRAFPTKTQYFNVDNTGREVTQYSTLCETAELYVLRYYGFSAT